MHITALTPCRRAGRYEVEIDGAPVAILPAELVASLGLRADSVVAESVRDQIVDEAANFTTYERAVRLLAARSRSVSELRRRLIQAKEEPARVERALARLTDQGFLDDRRYALQLARARVQEQGVSTRRFRQELFERGVAREAADEAIENLEEEGGIDEAAAIEKLLARKARFLTGVDSATRQRRLWGFLARRGYDSDAIRAALRTSEGAELQD